MCRYDLSVNWLHVASESALLPLRAVLFQIWSTPQEPRRGLSIFLYNALLIVQLVSPPSVSWKEYSVKPSTSRPMKLIILSIIVGLILLGITLLDVSRDALSFEHASGHLTKRAKDVPFGKDKLSYNQPIEKGNEWICNLPNDPPATRKTRFTEYDQLETNGWTEIDDHPPPDTLDELKELTVSCLQVSSSPHLQMAGEGGFLWLGGSETPRTG